MTTGLRITVSPSPARRTSRNRARGHSSPVPTQETRGVRSWLPATDGASRAWRPMCASSWIRPRPRTSTASRNSADASSAPWTRAFDQTPPWRSRHVAPRLATVVTTATLAALVGWMVTGWRLSSSQRIRPTRRDALIRHRAAQRLGVAIVCGWTGVARCLRLQLCGSARSGFVPSAGGGCWSPWPPLSRRDGDIGGGGRLGRPLLLPRVAAVGGPIDAISQGVRGPDHERLPRARPDHVGVRRRHGQCRHRRRRLVVEDGDRLTPTARAEPATRAKPKRRTESRPTTRRLAGRDDGRNRT